LNITASRVQLQGENPTPIAGFYPDINLVLTENYKNPGIETHWDGNSNRRRYQSPVTGNPANNRGARGWAQEIHRSTPPDSGQKAALTGEQ